MVPSIEQIKKQKLNKKLKAAYTKYVAYFNSGAIVGDRPMSWSDWKTGTAAKEITRKFNRGIL